jgi:hypothetical protein
MDRILGPSDSDAAAARQPPAAFSKAARWGEETSGPAARPGHVYNDPDYPDRGPRAANVSIEVNSLRKLFGNDRRSRLRTPEIRLQNNENVLLRTVGRGGLGRSEPRLSRRLAGRRPSAVLYFSIFLCCLFTVESEIVLPLTFASLASFVFCPT